MSLSVPPSSIAFALHDREGETIWHLDFLATIKASGPQTGGRLAVVEMYGPEGPARRCTSIPPRTSGSTSSRAS